MSTDTDTDDPTPLERDLLRALAEIEPAPTREIYRRARDDDTEVPASPFTYLSQFRKRGWVTSDPDPNDKRTMLNRLTDEGQTVLAAVSDDE